MQYQEGRGKRHAWLIVESAAARYNRFFPVMLYGKAMLLFLGIGIFFIMLLFLMCIALLP